MGQAPLEPFDDLSGLAQPGREAFERLGDAEGEETPKAGLGELSHQEEDLDPSELVPPARRRPLSPVTSRPASTGLLLVGELLT